MSHNNGDNGTATGQIFNVSTTPHYQMPSKPCAICGHVVRHPEPEGLREAAREHFLEAHAAVTA